tara:strand:- start:211 stop:408 length:198 start_codon:yes stop_codon:yes gene_type:complete
MINKTRTACYTDIIDKLEELDMQICRVKEQMVEIRRLLQKDNASSSVTEIAHLALSSGDKNDSGR